MDWLLRDRFCRLRHCRAPEPGSPVRLPPEPAREPTREKDGSDVSGLPLRSWTAPDGRSGVAKSGVGWGSSPHGTGFLKHPGEVAGFIGNSSEGDSCQTRFPVGRMASWFAIVIV